MKSHEFLTERVLNLHTPEDKAKYADQVWDLLRKSYANLGGFKSAANKEELVATPGYWKVIKRGKKITAVNLYRKIPQTSTFKVYASGAETELDPKTQEYRVTEQGKKDYISIKKADITQKRSWAEVSGPAAAFVKRLGAKPIPNKYAGALTDKAILALDPDGIHYTRLIMGEPHVKAMYGFVGLTPEQKKSLEIKGLEIHDLPK
jgi:hypothetical protein